MKDNLKVNLVYCWKRGFKLNKIIDYLKSQGINLKEYEIIKEFGKVLNEKLLKENNNV